MYTKTPGTSRSLRKGGSKDTSGDGGSVTGGTGGPGVGTTGTAIGPPVVFPRPKGRPRETVSYGTGTEEPKDEEPTCGVGHYRRYRGGKRPSYPLGRYEVSVVEEQKESRVGHSLRNPVSLLCKRVDWTPSPLERTGPLRRTIDSESLRKDWSTAKDNGGGVLRERRGSRSFPKTTVSPKVNL